MRTLLKAGVIYTVTLEPEDTPVRGNAMASGDDAVDRGAEEWVIAQLDRGNIAAWCCAVVTACVEADGKTFHGRATLGCCSYETEEECERSMIEEYDLPSEARADLLANLKAAVSSGATATKLLLKLDPPAAPRKA